jgi:hypothetical protein
MTLNQIFQNAAKDYDPSGRHPWIQCQISIQSGPNVKAGYNFDEKVELFYVPAKIIESNLAFRFPVVTFPSFTATYSVGRGHYVFNIYDQESPLQELLGVRGSRVEIYGEGPTGNIAVAQFVPDEGKLPNNPCEGIDFFASPPTTDPRVEFCVLAYNAS